MSGAEAANDGLAVSQLAGGGGVKQYERMGLIALRAAPYGEFGDTVGPALDTEPELQGTAGGEGNDRTRRGDRRSIRTQ